MKNIVLISPRLQHYRINFYEKLSSFKNHFKLTVLYGISFKEDGKAGLNKNTSFCSKGFLETKFRVFAYEIVYNYGLFSEVKRLNPDIIIILASTGNISYWKILLWANREKKKIIIWTSGWNPSRVKGYSLKIKNYLVSEFYKRADFFLTYSTYARDYVKSMGIDNSKIRVCYNGIDIDNLISSYYHISLRSNEIRKLYKLNNSITFLYVGGLIPEKKVSLLIDAFQILYHKYKHIKLIIIGDGPDKVTIENKVLTSKNPNIIYLGRIIETVDAYFLASDCLVLPGTGGLALNQAMYWGKTCIVSKADGTEDDLVIENKTGYRFLENDIVSLVSAMERRIIEQPCCLKTISKNARHLITNKSNTNNMLKIFVKTIEDLM